MLPVRWTHLLISNMIPRRPAGLLSDGVRGQYCPHDDTFAQGTQIICADGRASTRHLHGRTARGARCATVKVPAESARAVARSHRDFLRRGWTLTTSCT